jgi:hypothetical protein
MNGVGHPFKLDPLTKKASSMIASIMQPYLLPYIGYFQLVACSDIFVALDDVQYIKRGWINRNRILLNGRPDWITLPVAYGDHHLSIRERRYTQPEHHVPRMLRRVEAAYRAAPFFDVAFPFLQDALSLDESNVAAFNLSVLKCLTARVGIRTPIVVSSSLAVGKELRGQDMVIAKCRRVGATRYVNPLGGTSLYDKRCFADAGITLNFLKSTVSPYQQFGQTPVPFLSIVDVLMFNDETAISRMLTEFELL